ncbi:MAG TPA: hypothetical protein VIO38_17715 [Rariglobus sp.]
MIDFPRIRVWPRPIGVVIAPTENCQTLTPEHAEQLAADLIRAAYDARKLSPCPPGKERVFHKEKTP